MERAASPQPGPEPDDTQRPDDAGATVAAIEQRALWRMALLFYGALFGLATIWRGLAAGRFVLALVLARPHLHLEISLTAGALALALAFLVAGPRISKAVRAMQDLLGRLLGELSWADVLMLAAVSAVGEESFFRGALQPAIGLWATAAIFGLAHFPICRALRPWPAFAFAVGLALGFLARLGGDLLFPILLHFLINLAGLAALGRRHRQRAS